MDESTLAILMQNRVIRKLTPLLLDEVSSVREAAAGALRCVLCNVRERNIKNLSGKHTICK